MSKIDVDNMSDEEFENALADLDSVVSSQEEEAVVESPVEQEEEVASEQPESEEEETAITPEESDDDSENEEDEDSGETGKEVASEDKEVDLIAAYKDKVLPIDISVDGMKVQATLDELVNGFKKGMNYTKKTQEIAPYRKTINAIKEQGLTDEDIGLLIEAKQGKKEALAKLLKQSGVDSLDLDTSDDQADTYTPQSYGTDPVNEDMEEVKTLINSDTEYVEPVKRALNAIPDDLYQLVSTDHNALRGLYTDVKNGVFDAVYPEVMKMKNLQGRTEPTLQLYQEVIQRMAQAVQTQQAQGKVETISKQNELATKRKAATSPKTKSTAGKPANIDWDSLGEDEFDKEYEKIMGRARNSY